MCDTSGKWYLHPQCWLQILFLIVLTPFAFLYVLLIYGIVGVTALFNVIYCFFFKNSQQCDGDNFTRKVAEIDENTTLLGGAVLLLLTVVLYLCRRHRARHASKQIEV